ncbi:minor tail protein [Mycobacterium phage Tiger]|uniref:Structural protein n=2 Tax=Benedictvirus TaxID=2946819 RepID=H9NCS0_9CAUD|nr:minor tail protein [Mycobacterium phage Tiger]YP_010060969.1 minor tail protein [Mycobacterium phage Archetta]AFF28391.1 structural protein [Mycobacterium phage Tiger]ATW60877.1 hypothetical protein SEA_ARCHETTA_5 [Mycobacterium phage Archetta]
MSVRIDNVQPDAIYYGDYLATRVFQGNSLVWPYANQMVEFNTPGSVLYNFPPGTAFVDLGIIGGGCGGAGGGMPLYRNGGRASTWSTLRLRLGVDIPWSVTQLTLTVGAGSSGTAGGAFENTPSQGGASFIVIGGEEVLRSPGGTFNTGVQNGGSPGNLTFYDITAIGGVGGTGNGGHGTAPGAGGAGGNGSLISPSRGGNGAPGRVIIHAHS